MSFPIGSGDATVVYMDEQMHMFIDFEKQPVVHPANQHLEFPYQLFHPRDRRTEERQCMRCLIDGVRVQDRTLMKQLHYLLSKLWKASPSVKARLVRLPSIVSISVSRKLLQLVVVHTYTGDRRLREYLCTFLDRNIEDEWVSLNDFLSVHLNFVLNVRRANHHRSTNGNVYSLPSSSFTSTSTTSVSGDINSQWRRPYNSKLQQYQQQRPPAVSE